MKSKLDRQVKRLKAKLKRKYLAWHSIADRYDCGLHLTRHINPDMGRLENDMARIKSKLVVLGETVPALPGEDI